MDGWMICRHIAKGKRETLENKASGKEEWEGKA
jgi:hypothetical protein